ncbi:hypothetical protein VaNZ11_009074 [Volvox africanus]|uniref:Protein kinase domain-containing protein n=1 Tax=Volvox africanus TaxID=51714 RepID=A0ABQ5S6V8_9CHLO|nr:hypothetical protein VaNZ11_009074 [Volvox africanus]
MLPVDGTAASELPYEQPYAVSGDGHPKRVFQELPPVSSAVPFAVFDGSSSCRGFATSTFDQQEPIPPSASPGLPSHLSRSSAARAAASSRWSRRGSGAVMQLNPNGISRGSNPRLVQHLGRWLCGWACWGCSSAGNDGGDGDGGCIRRAGPRGRRLCRGLLSQPNARPRSKSESGRSCRSSPAAAARRPVSSVTGRLESANSGAGSGGGGGDSQLGSLPSLRTQRTQDSLPDSPKNVVVDKDTATDAATAAIIMEKTMPPLTPPPARWLKPPASAATTVSAPQVACSNGASSGAYVSTGQLPSVSLPSPLIAAGMSNPGTLAAAPAAGSCASSIASYASGMTTTSRPSHWGLLAGVLSAGLRSFSQLTNIMEPETGNLSREVVYDLTSRASQLDAVRAAGQVSDMSLVGSGSMGLVYRGRISEGGVVGGGGGRTVCVKHLVTRGADGMAAPATEGLLSRALAHPNVIRTLSWYVTRVAPENFLDFPEALAAMAHREKYRKERLLAKHGCRRCGTKVGKRRRSGDGGGGSVGGVGLCHFPAPAAASGSKTQSSLSAIPPPMFRGLMDNEEGRNGDSGGNDGGFSAVKAGSSQAARNQGDGSATAAVGGLKVSLRIAPSMCAANILDMVRASDRAGDGVDRTARASPGGIPVTRIAFGHHRSFTGSIAGAATRMGTQQRKAATVAVVLRPSGTPPDGRFMKASTPTPALPPPASPLPPPPLLSARGLALQQPRQVLPERGPSQNTDFEFSRSAPWAEDFYRSSDMTTYSILQQAATCDAAATAAATAAVGAGTVGLSLRRSDSTTAFLFSRDSVSSHLFTPSPNSSNHTPETGSLLYDANRGTLYGAGGTAATPAGTAGDNNLILSSTVAPMSSSLHPVSSQPGSGGGYGGGGGISWCRGRGMLTHTASRLHFSTTPITQLSIPEHRQAVGLMEDASLCGSTGGGTQANDAASSGQPDSRRLLLTSSGSSSSGEAMGYGNLPSIGGGGRPLCVAALLPPPPAAPTIAAAAAVAESSMCSTGMTAAGGAFTGGGGSGTGHSQGKNVDSGSILGAFFMRSQRNLKQRSLLLSEQGHRGRKDTNSGRARTGLLAAALAASNLHSPGHSSGMSRCQTPCTAIGSVTNIFARPAAARSLPPPAPPPLLLLDLAAGPPTGDAPQMHSGGVDGGGVSPSRISSVVLTRSAATDSSVKHPSGTSKFSTLTQMLTAGAGSGGLGATAGTSSADNLTTPSGNGSGSKQVASGSTPDGVVHTGSGSSSSDSGMVMEAAAATLHPPSQRLLPVVAGEGSAAQQEALEQGWRTLQQIMQRLNAKPGDFLTRIVMEDADQGSLLEALRRGRFGVEGERLPALLLTALDVARGMAFLHGHNVIHGDLKPSNVLLCSDPRDPRGFIAKVSDFGLARVLMNRDHDFLLNRETFPAGTVRYLAPEAVSGVSFKASDVWSFAVMLWQLVTGVSAPWPGLRSVQIIMGVMQDELRLQVPPWIYPPLGRLIESCLSYDHKSRPTFNEIVEKLQAMLQDISEHQELPPCAHAASAAVKDSSFPAAVTAPQAIPMPAVEPATAGPSRLPTTVLPWSGDPIFHASSEPWDRPGPVAVPEITDTAFPRSVTGMRESYLDSRVAAATAAPAAFHPATATGGDLEALGLAHAIVPMLSQGSLAPAVASPANIAAMATVAAVSSLPVMQQRQTCRDNSEVTDVNDEAIYIATPDSRSESRTGIGSESGSRSRFGSEISSATLEERKGRRVPGTPTHGSTCAGSHAASTAAGSGRTIANGAVAGSLNTVHCSYVATSTTLTAAASSNALTQMSSSWAQTATTTTLGGAVLDCDTRATLVASAWHSSALHANISNPLVGIGLAGSVGSSGLHPLSRTAGMAVGCSSAGTGSNAGAHALALERQYSQEAYGRLPTFMGAVLPDDQCNNSSIPARGGGAPGHHPAHMPMFTTPAAAGGALRVGGGLVHHAGGFTFGGGSGIVGEINHPFLPPVHEEQLLTSSSGLPTVVTHGSGFSSGVTQLSFGAGANTGTNAAGDRRGPAVSSELGSAAYGGTEASLPRMLQAGLIVLGTREPVDGRSAAVLYPGSMRGPGPIAMSGEREEWQRQRGSQASLDSLPLEASPYSAGRSD